MWICIAPCREHTSKALRYGTRFQGISQFYPHTPRSSANGIKYMNTMQGVKMHYCILSSRLFSTFNELLGSTRFCSFTSQV